MLRRCGTQSQRARGACLKTYLYLFIEVVVHMYFLLQSLWSPEKDANSMDTQLLQIRTRLLPSCCGPHVTFCFDHCGCQKDEESEFAPGKPVGRQGHDTSLRWIAFDFDSSQLIPSLEPPSAMLDRDWTYSIQSLTSISASLKESMCDRQQRSSAVDAPLVALCKAAILSQKATTDSPCSWDGKTQKRKGCLTFRQSLSVSP